MSVQISSDPNVNADIHRLLSDITEEFKTLIPVGPFLGDKQIMVINHPNSPITIPTVLPSVYLIGLTLDQRIYDQVTYQICARNDSCLFRPEK